MIKKIKILFCAFLSISFFACNIENKTQGYSLFGYLSWQQNNWARAAGHFYNALEESEKLKTSEYKNYCNFNIASTYLMQNEDLSANIKLEKIENTKDKYLKSCVFYQQGIVAFKKQDYKAAAVFFKKSIEYNPNSLDAKINYELSKKYLDSQESQQTTSKTKGIQKNNKINPAIIDLIRRKEKEKWNSENEENNKNQEKHLNDY